VGGNVPVDPASLGNGAQVMNPANSPNVPQMAPGQPVPPGEFVPQGQAVPGQPGQPQPGQQPGQPVSGEQQFAQPQAGQQQQFGQQQPCGQHPAQPQPAQHGQPQQSVNAGLPYPVPVAPGAGSTGFNPTNVVPQPGQPAVPNQGLEMINKILTTPRSQMNMAVPGASGLQIGGGIAGVASVFEGPSIKVYNEREKYQEWEFVYDMKKDKRLLGAAGAVANQQNSNPLGNQQVPNPLTNNSGSSFNNSGSSFNNNSGSSFNNPGRGQGGQQQQPVQIPGFPQSGRGR
jgi:hypothetical protein